MAFDGDDQGARRGAGLGGLACSASPVGAVPVAVRSGWRLSVYQDAGEAGGCWQSAAPARLVLREGPAADPERAAAEAARRARAKVRRYCAANRLNRLGTFTYRGTGCHDPVELRNHVVVFFTLQVPS